MPDSNRSPDLNLLRRILFESNAKILFITGAGVSVKSGIPLYRSEQTSKEEPIVVISSRELENTNDISPSHSPAASPSAAIWDRKLEVLCQKRSFMIDPRSWYSYFWFDSHHVEDFLNAVPNEAHYAIGYLCSKYQGRIRLVTQNVDTLHEKAHCPKSSCIEIHGRLGIYRCSRETCEFGHSEMLTPDTMHFWSDKEEKTWMDKHASDALASVAEIKSIYEKEESRAKSIIRNYRLPCCPKCRSPLMPLTLLFDENYQTHSFFSFDKFLKWLREAEVIVFIGTSFSVFCTQFAVNICRATGKTVFNVNPRLDLENFEGFQNITPSFTNPEAVPKTGSTSPRPAVEFNWDSDNEDGAALSEGQKQSRNKNSDTVQTPKVCHIQMKADEALMSCVIPSVQKLIAESVDKVAEARERKIWRAI